MLKTRVIVAAVALPLLIGAIVLGGWVFAGFVCLALVLAGDEYTRLLRQGDFYAPEWLVLALILLAVGATWFEHPDWREPGIALLLVAGMFRAIWGMEHDHPTPIMTLALAAFGGIYIGWLGSNLLAVRMLDDGMYLTLVVYGCVIMADSAAYFAGRAYGKHKMAPHVSPKKTWEGYAGGAVATIVFGAAAGALSQNGTLTVIQGAGLGAAIGLLAAIGDLGISAIKRQVGAKDSGHLIPGHGGILDRMDSVLVAATIGYYYIVWFT